LLLREVADNYSEEYMELINTLGGHCAEIVLQQVADVKTTALKKRLKFK
jgi:hypothetical protein